MANWERDLHEKVGSMEYEKLFAGLEPPALVRGGVLRKLGTAATLKRGTLLDKSSGSAGDGKLVIHGTSAASNETLTPDCILTDDVPVGTANDENATIYISGCFNAAALIMATGATLSEADKDALRTKGIIFGTVQEP